MFNHGSSDHKLILAVRNSKSVISKPRIIKKRSYKNFDPVLFIQRISKISWWPVYSSENVDEAVEIVTKNINNILDEMAPVKVIQVRNNYSPWISNETKKKMEERDLAQKIAEQTKSADDWNNYKRLRNNVNSVLRGEKKRWQSEKLEGCLEDTSSTWKHVKQFLGWNTGGPPTRLLDLSLIHI